MVELSLLWIVLLTLANVGANVQLSQSTTNNPQIQNSNFKTMEKNDHPLRVGPIQRAKNTEEGAGNSIRIYNIFTEFNDVPKYSDLTAEYLLGGDKDGVPLFLLAERFSNFLTKPVSFLKSKTKEATFYAPGSAAQYYSNWKVALGKRFKSIPLLQPPNDEWSNQLHRTLKIQGRAECFKRGEAASDVAASITRELALGISRHLIKEGTGTAYESRAVINTVRQAVGRGSESATATFDSLEHNTTIDAPVLDWREIKTGKSSLMSFFPEAKNWELDWNHSMACYMLVYGNSFRMFPSENNPDGVEFLFPSYVNVSDGGITAKIGRMLARIVKSNTVPGLTKRHTSHGFKHGVVDDLAHNPHVNIICIVCRANWDYSGKVSSN